jgi:putative AdoMet-dependent methyltransferase
MADLFEEKATDWDVNEMVRGLSSAIGSTILNSVDLDKDMKVMDFGAGTGLISSHIAPFVNKITAVDISEAMLNQLAAKPELKGKVEPACQNILEQPLDEEFDLIMSAMAMHHVEDTEKMIHTFAEHLKPGAFVALADLDLEDGTFHPADVEGVYHSGFDREAFEKILEKNHFTNIRFENAHTVDKEGKEYSIFLAVAKKQ